jgi:hypothetical protein
VTGKRNLYTLKLQAEIELLVYISYYPYHKDTVLSLSINYYLYCFILLLASCWLRL